MSDLDAFLREHGVTHFIAAEIAPQEQSPVELWPNIVPTLLVLEWLRERLGCPVYVSSGYRSPEHNREVGGAKKSQHVQFGAVDVHTRGRYTVRQMADALAAHPNAARLGIGAYRDDGHVHVDTRGHEARWSEPAGWWP